MYHLCNIRDWTTLLSLNYKYITALFQSGQHICRVTIKICTHWPERSIIILFQSFLQNIAFIIFIIIGYELLHCKTDTGSLYRIILFYCYQVWLSLTRAAPGYYFIRSQDVLRPFIFTYWVRCVRNNDLININYTNICYLIILFPTIQEELSVNLAQRY